MLSFCRTYTTLLTAEVPALANIDTLRHHFNWLCDGQISHTVTENLGHEIDNLEMFLRHQGRADVVKELSEWSADCDTYYSAHSGDLYKLVGVLRAADMFWNPAGTPVLLHKHGDPLDGDSPRIIVRANPSRG